MEEQNRITEEEGAEKSFAELLGESEPERGCSNRGSAWRRSS